MPRGVRTQRPPPPTASREWQRRGRGEHVTERGVRLLARNSLLNLLGQLAPMMVAVVTVPALIGQMGTDRFAILTLAWMTIGYFGLFDLGLGLALTQALASRREGESAEERSAMTWTALGLMAALGAAAMLALTLVAPWLVERALNIPAALRTECLHAMYLLALSLPCVIVTSGLRGSLEAYHRFDLVNAIRLPLGTLMYLGPLLVLPFSVSLVPIVALLVLLRVLAFAAHLKVCRRHVPELRGAFALRPALVVPLVRLGSWTTISNVVSPLMVYLDRFVIGALLPVAAVAYYVTPYDLVTKLWLIPAALNGAFFPALAESIARDRRRAVELFEHASRAVFVLIFPAVLLLTAFAPEVLRLWLGEEFARAGAGVLRWLGVGVLVNCIAQVAFAVIQGGRRPDLTAKVHMMEFPLYVAALWMLVRTYGITGAAMAWTLRVAVDAVVLLGIADWILGISGAVWRRTAPMMAAALVTLAGAASVEGLAHRALICSGAALCLLVGGWTGLLRPAERALILSAVRARRW